MANASGADQLAQSAETAALAGGAPVTSAIASASSPVWRARAGTSHTLTASHPPGASAGEFGGRGGRVGHVRQVEAGDHGGEGAVGDREGPGVGPHQRQQPVRVPGAGEHGRRQVDGDHPGAAGTGGAGGVPGAPASRTVLPAVTRAASSSGCATGMVNWLKKRW